MKIKNLKEIVPSTSWARNFREKAESAAKTAIKLISRLEGCWQTFNQLMLIQISMINDRGWVIKKWRGAELKIW